MTLPQIVGIFRHKHVNIVITHIIIVCIHVCALKINNEMFHCTCRAGCLILFMSNELLQEQTSKTPEALLPQVNMAVSEVDHYKDTLVHVSIPQLNPYILKVCGSHL